MRAGPRGGLLWRRGAGSRRSTATPMPRSPHRTPLSAHFLRGALGALLIIAGLGADRANAQSFDCRNARYADERTICQNQGLGQLDQELPSAYDPVMRKPPKQNPDPFHNTQPTLVTAPPPPRKHPP